jgi:hypothetical protein
LRGVAEHDGLAAGREFRYTAWSRHQFAADAQAERDLVADGAGDPAILGDASDRGEAHAGGSARDLENFRNDVQAANRGHVIGDRGGHLNPELRIWPPAASPGPTETRHRDPRSDDILSAARRKACGGSVQSPEKRAAHQAPP